MRDEILDDQYDDHYNDAAHTRDRRIDPEKLALWSIPAGAVIVAVAFMAGGWVASAGKPATGPRRIVAPAPVASFPPQPTYAVAPPPPPIRNPREPESNVLITQAAPPVSRPGRNAPTMAAGTPMRHPALSAPNPQSPAESTQGGFALPSYSPGASADPAQQVAADDETVRMAQSRAEMIRQEQARMERERAQRIAALDAARQAAQDEARKRRRSRLPSGLTSPWESRYPASRRSHDPFFNDSDFRDERSTWGRR